LESFDAEGKIVTVFLLEKGTQAGMQVRTHARTSHPLLTKRTRYVRKPSLIYASPLPAVLLKLS